MAKGQHLIAGVWTDGEETFANAPVDGRAEAFAKGTPEVVDAAVMAAETAFSGFRGHGSCRARRTSAGYG